MSTLFFPQASHLAYHYRYLPSQMHILRFFFAFAYIITTYSFHTLSNPRWKKKLLCRFLEQCSRCRTRALQSRKRKRKDLYLEGYVCMCTCGTCARACDVARATVWYRRSDQHIIFLRKRNSFFPFFYLISQCYA